MTAPSATDGSPRPGSPADRDSANGSDPSRNHLLAGLPSVLRGLSAIFWGLPLTLLTVARQFLVVRPTSYDLVLPPVAAAVLLAGIHFLGRLYPRERVWQRAVLTAEVLALILVGLAPFLYWWGRLPADLFLGRAVLLLLGVAFLLLLALMRLLVRLAALLPDETVRADARLFQALATYAVLVLIGIVVALCVRLAPLTLQEFLTLPRQPLALGPQAIVLFVGLVPVAMAMTIAWKLKEVAMGLILGASR